MNKEKDTVISLYDYAQRCRAEADGGPFDPVTLYLDLHREVFHFNPKASRAALTPDLTVVGRFCDEQKIDLREYVYANMDSLKDFLRFRRLAFQTPMLLGEKAAQRYAAYAAVRSRRQAGTQSSRLVDAMVPAVQDMADIYTLRARGLSGDKAVELVNPGESWNAVFRPGKSAALRKQMDRGGAAGRLAAWITAEGAARAAEQRQPGLSLRIAVREFDDAEFLALIRYPVCTAAPSAVARKFLD